MSGWKAKRFWTSAEVIAEPGGFGVRLDGRALKTPAKRALILPTGAMAEAVAEEWLAVEKVVDPRLMPVTRAANSAVDKVALQFAEVAEMIAAYGGSDLLCYRAEGPEGLVVRQRQAWDPMLDWAEARYGARLVATTGIVPVAQPGASLERLARAVRATTPFQLTALHDLVALTGSLVLGLAATEAEFDPEELWSTSRIDEIWQAELWGDDEEATETAALKRADFLRARHFWSLAGT
ncbi:MAG: ATPase [Rhodobacteraceae bacterium]|nr:ATPase [Paracoccaceae bacterium]